MFHREPAPSALNPAGVHPSPHPAVCRCSGSHARSLPSLRPSIPDVYTEPRPDPVRKRPPNTSYRNATSFAPDLVARPNADLVVALSHRASGSPPLIRHNRARGGPAGAMAATHSFPTRPGRPFPCGATSSPRPRRALPRGATSSLQAAATPCFSAATTHYSRGATGCEDLFPVTLFLSRKRPRCSPA